MGRSPCCPKQGLNSGDWTAEEDRILSGYIRIHGHGRWRNLPKRAGLNRCGQSCRLRWTHYLRPDIKRGNISPDEEELIIRMHRLLGNRWSLIAGRLPGRTDNQIKNYWNTHLKRKKEGQPRTHNLKKTRPESRPPLQNGAFKTTPEKIRMAVRHYQTITPDPCSNIGSSDEAFKLCQIHETYTNSSKTCCDLFVKDSIPEDDSERIAFCMADAYNLAETEADLQHESLHGSDHFAANAATVDELLFGLDNLSSPGYKHSDFSAGFKLEHFYSGPATLDAETNELEHESNMQQVNSIVTLPDDQRMKEFYDSTEPVDWNHVLNYIIN